MREHDIDGGVVFAPDASLVEQCMDAIPGLYGLVWANPKLPGYLEETARLLDRTALPRHQAAPDARRLPPERPCRSTR